MCRWRRWKRQHSQENGEKLRATSPNSWEKRSPMITLWRSNWHGPPAVEEAEEGTRLSAAAEEEGSGHEVVAEDGATGEGVEAVEGT